MLSFSNFQIRAKTDPEDVVCMTQQNPGIILNPTTGFFPIHNTKLLLPSLDKIPFMLSKKCYIICKLLKRLILILWLSFFCLSFWRALKSSSDRGSSLTVTLSTAPALTPFVNRPPGLPTPFVEASVGDLPKWLKKSNKVLAFI